MTARNPKTGRFVDMNRAIREAAGIVPVAGAGADGTDGAGTEPIARHGGGFDGGRVGAAPEPPRRDFNTELHEALAGRLQGRD